MGAASVFVIESDPIARERIVRELRALGYDVGDSSIDAIATTSGSIQHQEVVSAGGVSVDQIGHRVAVDGEFVKLAPREYRLLLFLMNNQDRVFSRKQLLMHVWDCDASVGPRTVDVHIRRLRRVLETYQYDRYIQTVRGAGYRFSLQA